MKKKKRRSISASRAASLKGWRTRKRMHEVRRDYGQRFVMRTVFDDILPSEKTINRIPKVEWTS